MSLQIQVHILNLHYVGTKDVLAILVSPLQYLLAQVAWINIYKVII